MAGTEVLRREVLHIHRMQQRQPLTRSPPGTKRRPTRQPCHALMDIIGIALPKEAVSLVHGDTNTATSSGCASASLAIQCKSCTNSANCSSPSATAQLYNAIVRVTTCDQFPASSSTLIAAINASSSDGIHIPLL